MPVTGKGKNAFKHEPVFVFAKAQSADETVPSSGFTSAEHFAALVEPPAAAVSTSAAESRNFNIIHGDVLDSLRSLPEAHFSGCLTDPPYELGFMSKEWDKKGIAHSVEMWSEVYRVLSPGSYLLAFGGTRTFHRLTCAIEDAGFEIRDHLMWLYGTGFPKSKACLKPGYEPIVLARKPSKRVESLNIDGCRLNPGEVTKGNLPASERDMEGRTDYAVREPKPDHTLGRWPSNVILDKKIATHIDGGLKGASRYYYCTKATQKERNAGLDAFADKPSYMVENGGKGYYRNGEWHPRTTVTKNPHPCVKPLDLCRWLAKLISPKGRLLVPFSGSGSEMIGGLQSGWSEVVGIERESEYVEVAKARLAHWQQ
jgi:site-specific DNA-methyltransferase (adenine-specific)